MEELSILFYCLIVPSLVGMGLVYLFSFIYRDTIGKYRIRKEHCNDGSVRYFIQQREVFYWANRSVERFGIFEIYQRNWFDYESEALEALEELKEIDEKEYGKKTKYTTVEYL